MPDKFPYEYIDLTKQARKKSIGAPEGLKRDNMVRILVFEKQTIHEKIEIRIFDIIEMKFKHLIGYINSERGWWSTGGFLVKVEVV